MSEAPRDQPPQDEPPQDAPRRDEDATGGETAPAGFSWEGQDAPRGATPADRADGAGVPRASDGGDLPPAPPPLPPPGGGDGPDATQVMGPPQPSQGGAPAYGTPVYQAPAQPPYQQAPAYGPPAYQPGGYGTQPGYGAPAGYGPPPGYAAPPPMSPESEDVRGKAVLWTILNGIAIFICANLGAIVGVILAAIAIGRSRTDVASARRLVRWSWIWFVIGFAVGLVFWTVWLIVVVAVGVTAG